MVVSKVILIIMFSTNADVSRDGVFDFRDTQLMLDFLNGGTDFDASYLHSNDVNWFNKLWINNQQIEQDMVELV